MAKEKKTNVNSQIKNDIFKFIKFLLSVALIIFVGYGLLNWVPFISKYDNYIIMTPSMVPVINVDDVVIIDNSISVEDLEEGQIIAFYHDLYIDDVLFEDQVIVHYLNTINNDGDETTYLTNSSNGEIDPWVLTEDDILGKHVTTISRIGKILRFAQSDIGKIVLIADVIIIYILIEFVFDDKKGKKDKIKENKDNEETD